MLRLFYYCLRMYRRPLNLAADCIAHSTVPPDVKDSDSLKNYKEQSSHSHSVCCRKPLKSDQTTRNRREEEEDEDGEERREEKRQYTRDSRPIARLQSTRPRAHAHTRESAPSHSTPAVRSTRHLCRGEHEIAGHPSRPTQPIWIRPPADWLQQVAAQCQCKE
ncbi:hypothetical protein BHE74_00042691, partial [Ensete ventricosum]